MNPGIGTVVRSLLTLLAAGTVAGCAVRTPAAPDRVDLRADCDLAWPARRLDVLAGELAATPSEVRWSQVGRVWIGGKDSPFLFTSPPRRVLDVQAAGVGIVRVLEPGRMDADVPLDLDQTTIGTGILAGEAEERPLLQFVSFPLPRTDEPPPNGVSPDMLDLRETARNVLVTQHAPIAGGVPRGIAVHVGSDGGGSYEQPLVDAFVDAGWLVLDLAFPITALRFPEIGAAVKADESPSAVDPLAAELDELIAERAYAVEACLEYLARAQPQTRSLPVVGIGVSAGALALPAIVARSDARFSAAVLIAGGASLLDIAATSDKFDGGMGLRGLYPGPRQRATERYRSVAALDPYAAAPCLKRMPVLEIQGAFDRIVPSATGDRLHERLGRPERWLLLGGHVFVFWELERLAPEVVAWVERAVARS